MSWEHKKENDYFSVWAQVFHMVKEPAKYSKWQHLCWPRSEYTRYFCESLRKEKIKHVVLYLED